MAFPVRIHRIEDATGTKFKAATSLETFSQTSSPLEQQLVLIEMAYGVAITGARKALDMARKNNRSDPRAFWLGANELEQFVHQLNGMNFFLTNVNTTFARDLGISESSLKKIRGFYRRFPDSWRIDPTITWNKYRENKVPSSQR